MELQNFMGLPLIPINAAEHGPVVDGVNVFVHVFMLALAIFWTGYFFYVLRKFRASKNPKADYEGIKSKFPKALEVAVVAVELVLLFGFSIPLYKEYAVDFPNEEEAVNVKVVAEQFGWNFHYAGPDGKFGKENWDRADLQGNPLGLDRENDPYAKDDVVSSVLHLPNNRPVLAHVTSKDVIHGFGIPALRVKQDAIPGLWIPTAFKPIRIGKYMIACSQLCGLGHARMRGFVFVHPEEDFDRWLTKEMNLAKKSASWFPLAQAGMREEDLTEADLPIIEKATIPPVDLKRFARSDSDMVAEGKTLFAANCASCHGDTGIGDGVAGQSLEPKPRNLTSMSGWTNGSRFSSLYATLEEGIEGTGMAGYGYMKPEDRFKIIHYVRTLGQYPGITSADISNIDRRYGLSRGRRSNGQIPVSAAMAIMAEDVSEPPPAEKKK